MVRQKFSADCLIVAIMIHTFAMKNYEYMKGRKKIEMNSWGYGSVKYDDCMNLDARLAAVIAEHLRAFKKALQCSSGAGYPSKLFVKCGMDSEAAMKEWMNILGKMLYSFDHYGNEDADDERINEGMQLFVEYFRDLWI